MLIATRRGAALGGGRRPARGGGAGRVVFPHPPPPRHGIARAKLLAEGAQWPITGLWIAQRALFGLLAVPLLAVPLFVSDFSGTHKWPVIVLTTSAVLLLTAFGEVVEASSRVVCYIDRRCRREGLDIRVPRREAR
ncbi:hypothetical protein [Nocardia asiatica]|uniref:hypothetical protein n=1 Tax=Nocardia asiatica TaxID=209252 RepID=UPI002453CE81|nr:hypothetical protein [Nocardia asiatica]